MTQTNGVIHTETEEAVIAEPAGNIEVDELSPAKVLLVDDRRENLLALAAVLEPTGVEIVQASSGKAALKALLASDFAVILLDVQMPEMDGFETATLIKQRERSRNIPIIFVTAINTDERFAFRGYQTGAVDYLAKPIDPDMLRSKVRVFIDLHQQAKHIALQAERLRAAEQREAERRREAAVLEQERRHLAERAENERQLQQFKETLDATRDAVFLFDADSLRCFYVNQGASDLLGYATDDLLGRTLSEFIAESDTTDLPDLFRSLQATGEAASGLRPFEMLLRPKSGRPLPVEATTQYVAPVGGTARFVSIMRDISERKRAEAKMALLYERERKIAEVLQQSIVQVPPEDMFPGLTIAPLYQAAWDEANVGGDYLDVFALDRGKVALIVGDVSGKGLNAATRTAEVKYALRAYLREASDPARALTRLNTLICETRALSGEDHSTDDFGGLPGASQFICVSVAVVDSDTGATQIAAAGAEPPLLLNGTTGETRPVPAKGLPIGIEGDIKYQSVAAMLEKGDLLLLLTDGITEARRGKDFFGYEGLQQTVSEAALSGSVHQVGKAVMEAARRFAGGKLQDDACLLVAAR